MGSDEAERRFRALFDGCYRPLLGYALRRADSRAAAEDVVAETFLVAWRRIGDVPENSDTALAWLFGVARRVSSNTRRGDARRERLLARLSRARNDQSPDTPLDEAVLAGGEASAAVAEAIRRLRPADAEILQLALWEQLTHAQIAVVLDCSVNAVAIRLHRARKAFGEEMRRVDNRPGQIQRTHRAPSRPEIDE